MSVPTPEEVIKLLSLTEKELLAEIGKEIHNISYPYDFPAFVRAPEPLYIVDHWFRYTEVLLYGKLCLEHNICEKYSSPGFNDDVTLVLVVGDIISSLAFGVPPFTLSALLVKRGLKSFCHCGKVIDSDRRASLLTIANSLRESLYRSKKECFRGWLALVDLVVIMLTERPNDSQPVASADCEGNC